MGVFGSISLIFVRMASLGIREEMMGILYALAPATSMFGMLFSGRLADLVGRKQVFLTGFSLTVLCPLVFAFAHDTPMMALGFVMMGIAFGPFFIGSAAHIGDLVPARQQGTMLGLFESSRAMGGVIGPLVAGAIVPVIGFQAMFLVMAVISFLGLLSVIHRKEYGRSESLEDRGGKSRT
jgi:MFS family permease